jgi:ferredoxin--NADP+ reductase
MFWLLLQGTKLNSRGVEVPQHVRLYSIASSRYGDSGDGKTCTLCVVRVIYPGGYLAMKQYC